MQKTILITGATSGIGLETAKHLAAAGQHVLIHGRSAATLEAAERELSEVPGAGPVGGYRADLSTLAQVDELASAVAADHPGLDVLINNAGVFATPEPVTGEGLDLRFVVNTLAPYRLTRKLLPLLGSTGRVVNLSSAAQASVDLEALAGRRHLADNPAYAQSKLALTMWSNALAESLGAGGPVVVAVNPGSFLGTKMVKEAYGVAGSDVGIGAEVLVRAALSDEFATASGRYFDNDSGRFAQPHPDALDPQKRADLVGVLDGLLDSRLARS